LRLIVVDDGSKDDSILQIGVALTSARHFAQCKYFNTWKHR
jgi:glycosyltransferase involved in cell wall biosynthesis